MESFRVVPQHVVGGVTPLPVSSPAQIVLNAGADIGCIGNVIAKVSQRNVLDLDTLGAGSD